MELAEYIQITLVVWTEEDHSMDLSDHKAHLAKS